MSGKVLIVGVASGLGRLLAYRLARTHTVVGADREPWVRKPATTAFYRVDVRSRAFEDVFRTERPDAVVHAGFVRHFRAEENTRFDVNVRGTRALLDHCAKYEVERVCVLSTSYVYGALPDNPSFMTEERPLLAGRNYPEIRDLVDVDALAAGFMWQHPDRHVCVLRPVPTLGHYVENSMVRYLRQPRTIVMMGFNPMLQFMHEEDLADAVASALERNLRGVYNVTGPGCVPLDLAIRETGGRALSLPETIARPLIENLFRVGLFHVPPGAIDFIKYGCTIAGERFEHDAGFRPVHSLRDSFRAIRH